MAQTEADLSKGFEALYAPVEKAEQERKTALGRNVADVEKAIKTFETDPARAAPDEPKLPDAPQPNFGKDSMEWLAASAVIAGLAGALSRRHGTNALTAFAGAINGFRQGKMDVFEQQYATWKAENQKQIEESKRLWQKRQAILENDRDNIDIQMKKLEVNDTIWQNNVGVEAAKVRNYTAYVAAHNTMEAKLAQMQAATDRLQLQYDKFISDFTNKTQMSPAMFKAQQDDIQRTLMQQKPPNLTEEQWAGTAQYKQLWDAEWQKRKMSAGAGQIDDGMVSQRATGEPATSVVQGWGNQGIQARMELNRRAIDLIQQQNPNMSRAQAGAELAMRDVEYRGGTRSVTQLTTMLGATRQAVDQLDFNVKKATEEMNKLGGLGSTNILPIFNAIARGEERWTGDPAYSSLFFYINAAAMESARLLSGGQASIAQLHEGARQEASNWANVNMTPAQWLSVSQSMRAEGQERIKNFTDAINSQRGRMGGGSNTFEAPRAEPQTPAATPGGGGGWSGTPVQ